MSTTYEALAPELRLALRAACEVSDPVERGRRRAEHSRSRLLRLLSAVALCIALVDVALLMGG